MSPCTTVCWTSTVAGAAATGAGDAAAGAAAVAVAGAVTVAGACGALAVVRAMSLWAGAAEAAWTPPELANITRTAAIIVAASCCWPLNAQERLVVVRPAMDAAISNSIGIANRAHATQPTRGRIRVSRMTLP